jgi:hypothetical protein
MRRFAILLFVCPSRPWSDEQKKYRRLRVEEVCQGLIYLSIFWKNVVKQKPNIFHRWFLALPSCAMLPIPFSSKVYYFKIATIFQNLQRAYPNQAYNSARNYRPSFRENKPKTLVFND